MVNHLDAYHLKTHDQMSTALSCVRTLFMVISNFHGFFMQKIHHPPHRMPSDYRLLHAFLKIHDPSLSLTPSSTLLYLGC